METFSFDTLSTSHDSSNVHHRGPAYFWVLEPQHNADTELAALDLPALIIVQRDDHLLTGIAVTPKSRSSIVLTIPDFACFPFKSIYDLNSDHFSLFLAKHSSQAAGVPVDVDKLRRQMRRHEQNDGLRHTRLDPKRIETVDSRKFAFSKPPSSLGSPVALIHPSCSSKDNESIELDHWFGLLQRRFHNSGISHVGLYYDDDSEVFAHDLLNALQSEALSATAKGNARHAQIPLLRDTITPSPSILNCVPAKNEPTLWQIMSEWIAGEKKLLQHPSFSHILKLEDLRLDDHYLDSWQHAFRVIDDIVSPRTLRMCFFDIEHGGLFKSAKTNVSALLEILTSRADPKFIKWALNARWEKDLVKEEISSAEKKWSHDRASKTNVNPFINICNQEFRNSGLQSFLDDAGQYAANLKGRCEKLLTTCQNYDEGQALIPVLKTIIELHDKKQAQIDQKNEMKEALDIFIKAGMMDVASDGNSIQAVALVRSIKNGIVSNRKRTLLVLDKSLLIVDNVLVSETTGQVLRPNMIHKEYGSQGNKCLKIHRGFPLDTTAVSIVNNNTDGILELASHNRILDMMVEGISAVDILREVEMSRARARANIRRSTKDPMPKPYEFTVELDQDKTPHKVVIDLVHESNHLHPGMYDHIISCGSAFSWSPTMSASFCHIKKEHGGSLSIETHVASARGFLPFTDCIHGVDLAGAAREICRLYASMDTDIITHHYGATARLRHSVIQESLFGPGTLEQVKTNRFVPLRSVTAVGGGERMSASTSLLSNVSVMSNASRRHINSSRSNTDQSFYSNKYLSIPQPSSPTDESIMSSVRSRISFASVFSSKRNMVRDSSAVQGVLVLTCKYFINLICAGVDLSQSPAVSSDYTETFMPSGVHPVKLSMDHRPLLDKMMRSGSFKDEHVKQMFPRAVFTAVAEYFATVTSVVTPNQWAELASMIHTDLKSRNGFALEITPMVMRFMDPPRDTDCALDVDRHVNFRLYMILVYLVEYSRKHYKDQNAYPKEISGSQTVLHSNSMVSWEAPMSTLLKGFANGTNRYLLVPFVKHFLVDILPSSVVAQAKNQYHSKQQSHKVAGLRSLVTSLDSMDRKVAKKILTSRGLDNIVTYTQACECWHNWKSSVPHSTTTDRLTIVIPQTTTSNPAANPPDSGTGTLSCSSLYFGSCATAKPSHMRDSWANKMYQTHRLSNRFHSHEEFESSRGKHVLDPSPLAGDLSGIHKCQSEVLLNSEFTSSESTTVGDSTDYLVRPDTSKIVDMVVLATRGPGVALS